VVWQLDPPPLSGQHAPTELTNGNILMFDNGPTRLDQTFLFSTVIEVNPGSKKIVWKYLDANPQAFYSDLISNAQRLPSGNTLVNEGMFGRFFEVTPVGRWYGNTSIRTLGRCAGRPNCRRTAFFACIATQKRKMREREGWSGRRRR
jgi:hypothetical protein